MNKKVLFCFTFAGGTAGFFDKIAEVLPADLCIVKFDYPGHGNRHREKLCQNFDEVVNDLYPLIRDYILKNNVDCYALLGYSMGSITAFAMLQFIEKKGEIIKPEHVFLSAHEPKTKIRLLGVDESETDDFVKDRTIKFGAVPANLIDNERFWRVYLPIYKADYLMIARYHFEDIRFTTDVSATIFYSEQDTRYEDMKNWEQYFSKECEYIEYDGPHFFINEHYKEMAEIIKNRMECQ